MERDLGFYLFELRKAVAYIAKRHSEGSAERYRNDDDFRFAIERNLSMIGEIAAKIRTEFPTESQQIHGLKEIVGFRNIVIHDYWRLDQDEVWSIIESHIPVLGRDVEIMFENLPDRID